MYNFNANYEEIIQTYNQRGWDRTIPDSWMCSTGSHILCDAVQTVCGCRYCRKCIEDLLSDTGNFINRFGATGDQQPKIYCQGCSEECQKTELNTESLISDNAVNKEILSLKVRCFNSPCKHVATIRQMPDHLRTCYYRTVSCDLCHQSIPINLQKDHMENVCQFRTLTCKFCGKDFTYDQKSHHYSPTSDLNFLCDNYITSCEFCGQDNVNLKQHIQQCTEKPKPCIFQSLGCNVVCRKDTLVNHIFQSGENHILAVVEEMKQLRLDVNNTVAENRRMREENEKLNEELKLLKLVLNGFQVDTSSKLLDIDKKLNENSRTIKSNNKASPITTGSLLPSATSGTSVTPTLIPTSTLLTASEMTGNEREFYSLQPHIIDGSSMLISRVQTSPIFRNGHYLWRIQKFSHHKNNAVQKIVPSISSEPFYTSEFGYKMCLKIYPNGDGPGQGTHLSVFFTLMRGDYDDMLNWPFKNKVVLSLIDPNSKSGHRTDVFRPDSSSSCYQQPRQDYNIASGSPRFVPLSDISKFIKNDSIFIKIDVLPN